jgi:hypothetical protein
VELFLSLQQDQAYLIRQKLLEALGSESTNSVRNKIGDAVAEIAREYSDNSSSVQHPLTFMLLTSTRGTVAGDIGCLVYFEHVPAGRPT